MMEVYAGGALFNAMWMIKNVRPRAPGEWLAFLGMVAVWPALLAYALFHAARKAL